MCPFLQDDSRLFRHPFRMRTCEDGRPRNEFRGFGPRCFQHLTWVSKSDFRSRVFGWDGWWVGGRVRSPGFFGSGSLVGMGGVLKGQRFGARGFNPGSSVRMGGVLEGQRFRAWGFNPGCSVRMGGVLEGQRFRARGFNPGSSVRMGRCPEGRLEGCGYSQT